MTATEAETEPLEPPTEPESDEAENGEEDGEEDEAADGEPEASAPEPRPMTEKELEAREKKNDAEKLRHAERIGVIYADDAVKLIPCEACGFHIPGFHWPASEYPEGGTLRALYEFLAGGEDVQPKQPQFLVVCEACNGLGQWLTGSRRDDARFLTCSDCGSLGYIDLRKNQAQQPAVAAAPVNGGEAAPAAPVESTADFLGRPLGHPNYGILPIYLTPEGRARDVADGYGQ
jgi:hypothetical protein